MEKTDFSNFIQIMTERFGQDTLISLATIEGNQPAVRIVNSYYENGAFYTVTYALSNKIKQIEERSLVAICGEWFTAHGIGENMGYICSEQNMELATKLKKVFSSWYFNGHINEKDTNTIILRIQLTDAILFNHGTKYTIDFKEIELP